MGTWETKLQQVLKYSQNVVKTQDKADAHYAKVIAAANALSSAHAKVAPAAGKIRALADGIHDLISTKT